MHTHPVASSTRRPSRGGRGKVRPPSRFPKDLTDRTARDLMTENPMTIDETAKLRDAAEMLSTLTIRHLPVMRGNTVVGMLSDRDFNGAVWTEGSLDSEQWRRPASSAMNTGVVAVTPEATLQELADLMLENRIGALPVIDDRNEELLGIVSYVDILRALRDASL
jgi:CBS domain-containing protein